LDETNNSSGKSFRLIGERVLGQTRAVTDDERLRTLETVVEHVAPGRSAPDPKLAVDVPVSADATRYRRPHTSMPISA
jgi:hypothetical protein